MKSIDLFAGAGGLSCGLRQAGITPLLANEWIAQFTETYKLNYPDTDHAPPAFLPRHRPFRGTLPLASYVLKYRRRALVILVDAFLSVG